MSDEGKFYLCVGIGDNVIELGLSASDISKDIIKFFGTGGAGGSNKLAQGGGLVVNCKYPFTKNNLDVVGEVVVLAHLYKVGKLTREELDEKVEEILKDKDFDIWEINKEV